MDRRHAGPSALMQIQACALNGKPGYQYGDTGTCFTYEDGNESARKSARQRAYVQGQTLGKRQQQQAQKDAESAQQRRDRSRADTKVDVARRIQATKPKPQPARGRQARELGQSGVRGVHASRPLQRTNTATPPYSKRSVNYGQADDEHECSGCRFFSELDGVGSCSMVKGQIDPEAWCRLYSPMDAKNLDEPRHLTHTQVAKFYELGSVKLDDVQGARRSWVPIFPEGTFQHPEYGTLDFSLAELRKYVMHFRQRVRKIDIAVDIDHKNEEAVGWLKDVDLRPGVGLFGLVDWNQYGAGLIADKRYRYISPQFGEYVDEESGQTYDPVIVALTITNFPFLKSMTAIGLRKKEGRGPTVIGKNSMRASTTSTRLKSKSADDELDDDELKDADDADVDLKKAKKTKKAKKAMGVPDGKQADDDELMDGDSDEAMQSSELDDDELEDGAVAAKLYDEDDVYDDESADQFEQSSRGDTHPENVSKGKPGAYKPGSGGRSSSDRSVTRVLSENRALKERMRALEEQMREGNRVMRLSAVREQVRKLAEPKGAKKLTFTKPVMDEFRKLALGNKEAGNSLFRILSLIQKDGMVSLSVDGRTSREDDDENDPTGQGDKVLRDKKSGKPVIGLNEQRRAMMYAREHKLNWEDLEDRMTAYLNSGERQGVELDDDEGEV